MGMENTSNKNGFFSSISDWVVSRLSRYPNVSFSVGLISCAIIIPVVLSIALSPIKDSTSAGAIWIEFWGSFLGALIGAAITYLVMYRTFSENNKNNQTERDSSFKLHRAETLRNDYREQSKCINHFVDTIQGMISRFDTAMLPEGGESENTDIVINRNAIEVKAELKKAHDIIFDIPISDVPAKRYLQKIEKLYSIFVSAIDTYSSVVGKTNDYVNKMAEEDVYANRDRRFIESPSGLTPFDNTIYADIFNLIRNRDTDNMYVGDSSEVVAGWKYLGDIDTKICYKPLDDIDGFFLAASPSLVHALFLSENDKDLNEEYRRVLLAFARQIGCDNQVDANVKNFEASLENYIAKIRFDNLMVIPIVITRYSSDIAYSELNGEEEITPIVLTDKCREMIKKRFYDQNNFIWSIDEQGCMPGCRYEIDDELRMEIFGYDKEEMSVGDDSLSNVDAPDFIQYLDFLFMDIAHPELNIFLLNPALTAKILKVPLLIEDIHKDFHLAVKKELLSLTSL